MRNYCVPAVSFFLSTAIRLVYFGEGCVDIFLVIDLPLRDLESTVFRVRAVTCAFNPYIFRSAICKVADLRDHHGGCSF